MTPDDTQRRLDLSCDIMLEGMTAIRNISGALRAWDLKDDALRLKAINSIAEALYTLDARSDVAMGVTRDTFRRLCADQPEIASMCPVAAAWSEESAETR